MRLRSAAIAFLAFVLACAGCSFSSISSGPEITQYDFGPAPAKEPAPGLRRPLLIYDVNAPAWLDSPYIYYRLAFQYAARPQAYADSRWVGSPGELIAGRMRGRLAASGEGGVIHPADGNRASNALR